MQKKNSGRKIEDFGAEQKRDRALKTSELSRKTSFFSAQIRWEKIDKKTPGNSVKISPKRGKRREPAGPKENTSLQVHKKCKVQ